MVYLINKHSHLIVGSRSHVFNPYHTQLLTSIGKDKQSFRRETSGGSFSVTLWPFSCAKLLTEVLILSFSPLPTMVPKARGISQKWARTTLLKWSSRLQIEVKVIPRPFLYFRLATLFQAKLGFPKLNLSVFEKQRRLLHSPVYSPNCLRYFRRVCTNEGDSWCDTSFTRHHGKNFGRNNCLLTIDKGKAHSSKYVNHRLCHGQSRAKTTSFDLFGYGSKSWYRMIANRTKVPEMSRPACPENCYSSASAGLQTAPSSPRPQPGVRPAAADDAKPWQRPREM